MNLDQEQFGLDVTSRSKQVGEPDCSPDHEDGRCRMCGWVSNERPPFVKTFGQARVEASSRGFSKMSDEYFLIKRKRGSF